MSQEDKELYNAFLEFIKLRRFGETTFIDFQDENRSWMTSFLELLGSDNTELREYSEVVIRLLNNMEKTYTEQR